MGRSPWLWRALVCAREGKTDALITPPWEGVDLTCNDVTKPRRVKREKIERGRPNILTWQPKHDARQSPSACFVTITAHLSVRTRVEREAVI